ncbi:MAG TPA: DegV family protein [Clostridiales bacterium]|nr:DegV family protein [Clostridiales bacterium]
MNNYVLFSDSTLDLPQSICDELDVNIIPMSFTINEKEYLHYCDQRQMKISEFYSRLRDGENSTTSQINYNRFFKTFDTILSEGKDILYICFTSGMSGTYNTCLIALSDLKDKYPDRKIYVVDSLCASVGEGVFVMNVAKQKQEGMSLSELFQWAEDNKRNVCHWFVVDDLDHLKKGGRISSVAATFGKALQIKPLLSVDNDGKLKTVGKIRGNKKIFDTFLEHIKADGVNTNGQTVVIGHGDYLEGANTLADMLKAECLIKSAIIADIGPVIGTHTGTGMLALAFMGNRKF